MASAMLALGRCVSACGVLECRRGDRGSGVQDLGQILSLDTSVIHPCHCAGALPGANVSIS